MKLTEMLACFIESFIVVSLCDRFLGFKQEKLRWFKAILFFLILSAHSIFFTIMSEYKYISIVLLLVIIFTYCFVF